MLNQLLKSRYKIIELLGEGAFGETYLAQDNDKPSKPRCVVKRLKPEHIHPRVMEFFEQEAVFLERLGTHPQIPDLLAHFTFNNELYIVQEFVSGHPLSQEIVASKSLNESYVRKLLEDILETLSFVHQQGVIHRDIKPANVMRRERDDRLVLIDFGAVKELGGATLNSQGEVATSIVIGTLGYMPWEQTKGKPRFSSDIHALGIMSIQALTGISPLHLPEDPRTGEPIWRDKAAVSDALADVLDKMVRHHANDRYPSAVEALTALKQAIVFPSVATSQISSAPLTLASAGISSQQVGSTPPIPITANQATAQSVQSLHLQTNGSVETRVSGGGGNSTLIPIPSAVSSSASPQIVLPLPARSGKGRWLIGSSLVSIALIGGIGYYHAHHQQAVQTDRATLESLQTLKADKQFEECISQAGAISQRQSRVYPEAQHLLGDCALAQAEQFAANQMFSAAIMKARNVPQEVPAYEPAQTRIRTWAEQILTVATNQYRMGNFEGAVKTAKAIPEDILVGEKVKGEISKWQTEWQTNQTRLTEAKQALEQKNWEQALAKVDEVKLLGKAVDQNTAYWKQVVAPIVQDAESLRIAASTVPVINSPSEAIADVAPSQSDFYSDQASFDTYDTYTSPPTQVPLPAIEAPVREEIPIGVRTETQPATEAPVREEIPIQVTTEREEIPVEVITETQP